MLLLYKKIAEKAINSRIDPNPNHVELRNGKKRRKLEYDNDGDTLCWMLKLLMEDVDVDVVVLPLLIIVNSHAKTCL